MPTSAPPTLYHHALVPLISTEDSGGNILHLKRVVVTNAEASDMGSVSAVEDENEVDSLLLTTAETVLQMAEIAGHHESNKEIAIFYNHLRFHCIRLQDCVKRSRHTSSRLDRELVNRALCHIGSLVPETGPQELPLGDTALEFRLGVLNLHWSNVRNHADEAKVEFVGRWLALGASEDRHTKLDKALEQCADEIERQQPEKSSAKPTNVFPSPNIGEPSYGVWRAAQAIFDALLGCKGCSCSSQHEFGAKLELSTYRRPQKQTDKKPGMRSIRNRNRKSRGDDGVAEKLDFDMFLSMEHDWHEVCVQTMREMVVGFAVDELETPPSEGNAAGKFIKVEKLCRSISKTKTRTLQRLMLKLTSGQFFDMGFEKSIFWIDKTTEPISLLRCFEERHEFFTEKTKRILSLIIGYATLHLNGTSWLQPGWGSADIKFFQTTSHKTPLRPFIQTHLPNTHSADTDPVIEISMNNGDSDSGIDLDELDAGHRCPALISLAVVLIEVYFAKPFEKLAQMISIPLIEDPSGRISLLDVDQVFNGDEEMEVEGWRYQIPEDSPLLTAIDNCLNVELWENDEGEAFDNGTLTSRIYQHVVRFLELHLTCGFSQIPLDSVDKYARDLDFGKWGQAISSHETQSRATVFSPGSLTSMRTPSPVLPLFDPKQFGAHMIMPEFQKFMHQYSQINPLTPQTYNMLNSLSNCEADYKASQFFDDEMDDGQHSTAKYLTWRSEYENVYAKFITTHLSDPPSKPVKIAILDTGIDRDHYAFEAREENIKAKLNCYHELQKNVPDLNGHGTFTASLILDYAPDAELHVIKIADKENSRPDAKIVVNAINHAVEKWDVDIISISFGWPSSDFEGYDALEDAIDRAYGKKVLIFAAASNSGGRLGRAYPASSSQVICVHSTNTLGTPSDFSPTAEPNALNIATVGNLTEVRQISVWDVVCDADYGRHRSIPAAVCAVASIREGGSGTQKKGKDGGFAKEVCTEGPQLRPEGQVFLC
ncbi:major intracellular serine protease [Trichoderma arundinaceum]|uniref:Major intracellular serine protease n=1 Tax=Trichoderma arundinaceum TaxID=490622 RepID=A0A395NVA6_TRIAR|nr:major intracellular serine protease [Trichoderma arundinaceum]